RAARLASAVSRARASSAATTRRALSGSSPTMNANLIGAHASFQPTMRRSGFEVAGLGVGLLAGALALASGCGGAAKSSGANEPVASKSWEDGPAPDAAPAPDAKLSESECTQLFDHIAKLMQEGMPPDEWAANKDDLAAERATMI